MYLSWEGLWQLSWRLIYATFAKCQYGDLDLFTCFQNNMGEKVKKNKVFSRKRVF